MVFIALGVPLKQGKVPPNWWYGFRTRKTVSNPDIWYAVNRITGIDMIRAGTIIAAASLIMLALRNSITPEAAVAVLLAVMLVMVGWMAYNGFSQLSKM